MSGALEGILQRFGVASVSTQDKVTTAVTAHLVARQIHPRRVELRYKELTISVAPKDHVLVRYELDVLQALANSVAPLSVESVRLTLAR